MVVLYHRWSPRYRYICVSRPDAEKEEEHRPLKELLYRSASLASLTLFGVLFNVLTKTFYIQKIVKYANEM